MKRDSIGDSHLAASAAFLAFQASRRSRFIRNFASSGVSSFGGPLLVEAADAGAAGAFAPFCVTAGVDVLLGAGEAVLEACLEA